MPLTGTLITEGVSQPRRTESIINYEPNSLCSYVIQGYDALDINHEICVAYYKTKAKSHKAVNSEPPETDRRFYNLTYSCY